MPEWIDQYRSMVTIRLFEEQVNELYRSRPDARSGASLHRRGSRRRRGVRRAPAGRLHHLAPIAATGTAWPRAPTIGRTFAELLGKEAGYCRGKGGSMHIADHANGNLGANAIVGGSTGIATGAALFGQRGAALTRLLSASSARAPSARACSTR